MDECVAHRRDMMIMMMVFIGDTAFLKIVTT
jgi:hypothetical protein